MSSNETKNELEVMVLTDLDSICNNLPENPGVPDPLPLRASEFVEEFNSPVPVRCTGNASQHFQDENLLIQMARFLPRILEVNEWPNDSDYR